MMIFSGCLDRYWGDDADDVSWLIVLKGASFISILVQELKKDSSLFDLDPTKNWIKNKWMLSLRQKVDGFLLLTMLKLLIVSSLSFACAFDFLAVFLCHFPHLILEECI